MPKVFDVPFDAYKIVVSGDRDWTDKETIRNELIALPPESVIIHGACRGADLLADEVATERGLITLPCPAHWRHQNPTWVRRYGPCAPDCQEKVGLSAGPLRNHFMLRAYKPDFIFAFHDNIGISRGTRDLLKRAAKARIPGRLLGKDGRLVERW